MVPVLVGLLETTVAEGGGAVEVKLGRTGGFCAAELVEDVDRMLVTRLAAVDPMEDVKGVLGTVLGAVVPKGDAKVVLATLLAAVVPIEGARGVPITLLAVAVPIGDDEGVFVMPISAVKVVAEPVDGPWLLASCGTFEAVDSRKRLERAALALALPLEERPIESLSAVEASPELLLVVIESSKVLGPKELLERVDAWFEAL